MAFFVAFYSYKGGVGRTLALANVAYALAKRGKRVVLIDMDLEAPALLGFPVFELQNKAPKRGFLEYAAAYKNRGNCPPIKDYVHSCRQSPGSGRLWVMPSGRLGSSYQKTLGSLSWTHLHPRKGTPPLVEGLRKALVEEFKPHYVLIDSRTGLSDIGGLSTHLLADMVVLVFNLTRECLEGSIQAYRSFNPETTNVRATQLVASPIPPIAPSGHSVIEDRIRQAKENMPSGSMDNEGIVRILYEPGMALSETLAVLEPEAFTAAEKYQDLRKSIQRSNEDDVFSALGSAVRSRSAGRWEEGLKHLQSFVAKHPKDPEGFMEQGSYLLEAGRAEEAGACFGTATRLAANRPRAHRKAGEAFLAAGKIDEAVESLEKSRGLGDESREVFEALAAAYERQAAGYAQRGDSSQQLEAQKKGVAAQQRALDLTLRSTGQTQLYDTRNFSSLRDRFLAALKRRPSYKGLAAEELWSHLATARTLTQEQKYAVVKVFLDGKATIAQTVDLIRPIQTGILPADLEIRVTTEQDGSMSRLRYVLHSVGGKVGYTHYQTAEIRIQNLSEYQKRLANILEELEAGHLDDGSLILREETKIELQGLGRDLYRELFPKDLRAAYRSFRDRIQTLFIVSDEPWIPWELVKPYDREGADLIDDDFFCCRFQLTRWLAGETSPLTEFTATKMITIDAGRLQGLPALPYATEEGGLLAELAGRYVDVESNIISNANYDAVTNALRSGGHGVLHFLGHSLSDVARPDASRFMLADGRSLRPRDLLGALQARQRQDRPLVFFNAPSAWGGWAQRWILDCGCGAFLAPQWNVRDDSSYLFARAFYDALGRDMTLAAAVLEARLKVRKEAPGSTAWLAYSLYAHPNARVRLGAGSLSSQGD